jgi:hypothetical protein
MNRIAITLLAWAVLWGSANAQPVIEGFVEANQAARLEQNDALGDGDFGERSYPRSEFRAQLTARDAGDRGSFFLRIDVISDATKHSRSSIDLREAYLKLPAAPWLDLKVGRQVATWGTGDLIFANDLFAKDWEAFFTGLDDAYLKPPQDLLRVSVYRGGLTAEAAISPYFTPDNLPDGTRLSVYNPFLQQPVGYDLAPAIEQRAKTFRNGELFGRIFGSQGSMEWALYGYKGFWPTPQGAAMSGTLFYPRMWSGGASVRMPVGAFLVNAEGAAYISQDDADGHDPLIANSQLRGFVGAEKNLGREWTVGVQYYGELMMDYDEYRAGLMPGGPEFDELRSTLTTRINKFLLEQNLQLTAFAYWGVSDQDWHVRPAASYKISDEIKVTVGGSLLGGDQPYTMFGQFQDNSNIFARVRYSF